MNPPIAEVAGKLTEAQRQVIVEAEENLMGAFWRVHARYRFGARRYKRIRFPTLVALVEVGVIAFQPPRLTPLGQQVRAHLEESK